MVKVVLQSREELQDAEDKWSNEVQDWVSKSTWLQPGQEKILRTRFAQVRWIICSPVCLCGL